MGHTASILGAGPLPQPPHEDWETEGGGDMDVWEGGAEPGWSAMDVEREETGNGFTGRLRSMTCADEEAGKDRVRGVIGEIYPFPRLGLVFQTYF